MSTFKLLRENLASTILAALICGFLGFLFSLAIGFLFHEEAMSYRYGSSSTINTARLEAFERMQGTALGFGVAVGVLAAQSVFLVRHLRPRD